MSGEQDHRETSDLLDLQPDLEISRAHLEEELRRLEARGALERLLAVQEWGDLARLQLGARDNGTEHIVGDARDPSRPSENQCAEAWERLAWRWAPAWRRHDQRIRDAVKTIAPRLNLSLESTKVVALSLGIFRACNEARSPWPVRGYSDPGRRRGDGLVIRVHQPCRRPKKLRPVDLFPSKFRAWVRRRAFLHAEEQVLREANSDPSDPPAAEEGVAVADSQAVPEEHCHRLSELDAELEAGAPLDQAGPDPLHRVLDRERVRPVVEGVTPDERETLESLRVYHVEGGLPQAEAIRLIASERGATVNGVFDALAGVTERISEQP